MVVQNRNLENLIDLRRELRDEIWGEEECYQWIYHRDAVKCIDTIVRN